MIPRTDERPNTIGLQVSGKYEEGRAGESGIYPGMLLKITSDETQLNQLPYIVKKQTGDGTKVPLRIALEERLGNRKGASQGRTIDTAYTYDTEVGNDEVERDISDIVPFVDMYPGDIFMARVEEHAHHSVGAFLASAGDGTFVAAGSDIPLVQVVEDKDWAGVSGSQLLRVQAI